MWSICVIENSLKLNEKTVDELFKINEKLADMASEIWYDKSDVTDSDGNISFNLDHYEHMDFLSDNQEIVDVLKKNKVKGKVCFGCLDGDQFGQFWGYEFDGQGNMVTLTGTINWTVNQPKKTKIKKTVSKTKSVKKATKKKSR